MNSRFCGRAMILATTLIFLPVQAAFAQTQNLPPNLRTTPRNPDEAAYRQIQIQRTLDAQQRTAMKEMEDNARATAKFPGEKLPEMSEKDRRRIEALLAPDPEDLLTYKEFLDQDRTGIFRLFPNSDCESQGVIRIDGECQNHVPGGSSYSFRGRATTPDIFFNNGLLVAEGFFSQEVMTSLGDIAVEDVALSTRGLKFLGEFEPAIDFAGAKEQHAKIGKGVEADGILYSNLAKPRVGGTYAVRIVAYRNGNNLIKRLSPDGINRNSPVFKFLQVQQDNRVDLLIAFRVIRQDLNGNLTILWKELNRKRSPEINFKGGEELSDFK